MARRNTTRAIPLNITILNTLLLFLLLLLLHPTHAHPQASPGDGSLQPIENPGKLQELVAAAHARQGLRAAEASAE